jgi:hypothetical protein
MIDLMKLKRKDFAHGFGMVALILFLVSTSMKSSAFVPNNYKIVLGKTISDTLPKKRQDSDSIKYQIIRDSVNKKKVDSLIGIAIKKTMEVMKRKGYIE